MLDIRIKVNDNNKTMNIEMETKKIFANKNEEKFYNSLIETINQYKKFEESTLDELLTDLEKQLDYSQTGYDYTAEICRDCYNEIKNLLAKEIKKEVKEDE